MIYRLIDLPSNVIGFKALWHVSDQDLEEVLIPSVKDHVTKNNELNCLLILNNSVKHFHINAIKGIKHLMKWKARWQRIAIVSESSLTRWSLNFLSKLLTAEFKVFPIDRLDKAIEWASREK